jgi:hypothetical protein
MGRPKRKRLFGRLRSRWDNNIQVDFEDVRWVMDWVDAVRDRDRWRV